MRSPDCTSASTKVCCSRTPGGIRTFTPHITVAAGTALDPLHTLAGELNAKGLGIRGSISEIVLVEVTPAEIRHAARFQLGAAA